MGSEYKGLFNETGGEFDYLVVNGDFSVESLTVGNTEIVDGGTTDRTVTIPDTGGVSCEFLVTGDIPQTIDGNLTWTGTQTYTNPAGIYVDKISEYTAAHGVNIASDLVLSEQVEFETNNHTDIGTSASKARKIYSTDIIANYVRDPADETYYNIQMDSANGRIRVNLGGGYIDLGWGSTAYLSTPNAYITSCGAGVAHFSSAGLLSSSAIVNADVSASAAIGYSKLNLTTSVKAGDIDAESSTSGYVITSNGSGSASWQAPLTNVSGSAGISAGTYYLPFTSTYNGTATLKTNSLFTLVSSGSDVYMHVYKITTDNPINAAVYATTAGSATSASTATYATTAGSATDSTNAANLYLTTPFNAGITYKLTCFSGTSNNNLPNYNSNIVVNPFSSTITASLNGTADSANQVVAQATSANVTLYPYFGAASGAAQVYSGGMTYNSSSNTLTATNFNGTVSTATNATNATNVNLTNNTTNSSQYLIFSSAATGNNICLTNSTIRVNPNTSTITATNFSGLATNSTVSATSTLANDLTNGTYYPVFANSFSGDQALKTANTALNFNPSTQTLICNNFQGNASTCSVATSATAAVALGLTNDVGSATDYLLFSNTATGNQVIKTNTGLTCNPGTGAIGCTTLNATNVNATTLTGSHAGTIASATTGTTQSALDSSTKISTTSYTDTACAVVKTYADSINPLTLLSTQSITSGKTVTFATYNYTGWASFRIVCKNLSYAAGSATLNMTFSTNSGSSYISTNYYSAGNIIASNGTASTSVVSNGANILLHPAVGSFANQGVSFELYVDNVNGSTYPQVRGLVTFPFGSGTGINNESISGTCTNSTSVNTIKITSSQTISTGTFKLYGVL